MKGEVLSCPSCNNSMVTSQVSTFCPSCKYVERGKSESRCTYCGAGNAAHHSYTCPTNLHPDRREPTPIDNLLAAIDEISFRYQPFRINGWPALAIVEERYLDALEKALFEYRKANK